MKNQNSSLEYNRSFARIDLNAIKANFDALRGLVAPETKTMAVVKADAYGHGAVWVSKAIENEADYFAVADIEEALELREGGITKPILILSYTNPCHFETLIENSITQTIYNYDDAKLLSEAATKLGKNALIHIAVDTGMGRIGFVPSDESAETVKKITELPRIDAQGIFTHFACADSKDKASAMKQKAVFDAFTDLLKSKNVEFPIKHCCNSAATIDFDAHYDMVRLGISLYGFYPSDEVVTDKIELRPAMEVISHVIHVKEVEAGTAIGYGHTYTAKEKRRIATVCIGYADGFNRAFSNKGYVIIRGKKAPITGRVCMDQIMVDVTDIENVTVGDQATILGKNGSETITAEQLGEMCCSFNYEVVCTFMPRVVRVYYENGRMI